MSTYETSVDIEMRVVFFTHYSELYGANRSLLNLIDGLKLYSVQSFVIAPCKGDLTDALRGRGVPFIVVPLQLWSSERQKGKNVLGVIREYIAWRRYAIKRLRINLQIIPRVVRQMKKWNVDILYTNSSVIPLGAFVSMRVGRPHVWHIREFGKEDYNLTFDWGCNIFNFLLKQADAQICISKAICKYYEKSLVRERSHVVYNGIATRAEFDQLREKVQNAQRSNTNYVFAIVGLIHPNKGQDIAIKALSLLNKEFPSARLVIAGAGDVTSLKSIVENLDLANEVTFLGHVSDPFEVYLQSDAVLMCSKHEGMGRVTVEAMAACKPVIGYDNAGTSELIEHERTGLLFKGDEKELAMSMKRFIKNTIWAKQLGENGWKVAREKYSTEAYAKNIYNILCDLRKDKE